jgi:hypothetical protein
MVETVELMSFETIANLSMVTCSPLITAYELEKTANQTSDSEIPILYKRNCYD